MKIYILFFCLLSITLAAREKKVNLEDIENDNLANERQSHNHKPSTFEQSRNIPNRYISPSRLAATPQPQVEFGFRPMKTQSQHPEQQPLFVPNAQSLVAQQHYNIPQYYSYQQVAQLEQAQHPIQYQQVQSEHQPVHAQVPQFKLQYQQVEGEHQVVNAQGPQLKVQYEQVQSEHQPAQDPQLKLQYQQVQGQHQHAQSPHQLKIQYEHQLASQQPQEQIQQVQQAQFKLQEYDLPYNQNYQHLQDNYLQQYYSPHLAYLQPQAGTNQIQAVAPPKGGVEYVMYVPSQYLQQTKPEQTQAVQAAHQPQQYVHVQPRDLNHYRQQIQYVEVPIPQHYQTQQEPQPQQTTQQFEIERVPDYDFMTKKYNPKSLLDSYVPSLLQLQYMKQHNQKAQLNDFSRLKPKQVTKEQKGFLKNLYADFLNAAQTRNIQYLTPPPRQPARH